MTTRHVFRPPLFTDPPEDPKLIPEYISRQLIPALYEALRTQLHTFPAVASGEVRAKEYTEATKPSATDAGTAAIILSTDAATKPQMSDGTVWIPLAGGGGSGAPGPPGPPGLDGADGAVGEPGPPGPAGSAGPTGSQGPLGPAIFLTAEDGLDGEAGLPGPAGPTGAAGAQGPPGLPIFLVGESAEDGLFGPPGGGAPTGVDYLVGTADAALTNEIVVGPTPGGQLGGTWASPDVRGIRETFTPTLLTFGIISDGGYLRRVGTSVTGGGVGEIIWNDFTVDLGAARSSGTFDVATSGRTADKDVIVIQTAKAIASKGNARDEAEMDQIQATGYVVDAATIRVYWNAPSVVVGTYAFAYAMQA